MFFHPEGELLRSMVGVPAAGDTLERVDPETYNRLREELLAETLHVVYSDSLVAYQEGLSHMANGALFRLRVAGSEGLACTEHTVSICAKDSGGPYHYDVVRGLIAAARRAGAAYAVDVYPHYGSDVEATLRAGYDLRHGLIGAGVYASHGYERSHRDGVENAFKLLKAYLG